MRKILLIGLAALSLSSIARADGFTVISSRAQQNPSDIIDWSQLGSDPSVFLTPQLVTTFSGNSALVGNTIGTNFLRVDEGSSWTGNFDFGETLVWTGPGASAGAGPGPFAIELANPVGSFGFSIQTDESGPFSVTVQVYDSSLNALFSQTFNGGVSNNLENGSALFVGLGDTTAVNIGAIVISTSSADASFANDFAIDDPSFTYATSPVPEPASILLLGSGLVGLAGVRRRWSNKLR